DVQRLRALLHAANGIIAGDAALGLFCPSPLRPSTSPTVDLYCPPQFLERFMELFIGVEGFSLTSHESVSLSSSKTVDHYYHGLRSISTLHRSSQVLSVRTFRASSPLPALCSQWTTLAFNFISAEGAYCAYPALTLRGRGLL
ncbi:hypothetical protein FKP32DRAFT_1537175, partial [Trametes sanguinea]